MRPNKNALSLHTSFPPPLDHLPDTITVTTNPSYDSPTTTATASPSQSPSSSPLRRLYHTTSNRFSLGPRSDTTSTSTDDPTPSRSHSPFRLSLSRSSIFRRPSLVLLRRRPSKVDMALSAERSRCDGDAIERQGLDLMEPRPVDPIAVPMDSMAQSLFSPGTGWGGDRSSTQSWQSGGSTASRVSQPRFVMGGIFEVMEGRA